MREKLNKTATLDPNQSFGVEKKEKLNTSAKIKENQNRRNI
jgi:hypothetical protein